jgi:hypothetical protein
VRGVNDRPLVASTDRSLALIAAREIRRELRGPPGLFLLRLSGTFTPLGFLCARGLPVASKGSRMDRYSAIINLLVVAVLLVILIASRLWRDE